jgi:hypothetical protein
MDEFPNEGQGPKPKSGFSGGLLFIGLAFFAVGAFFGVRSWLLINSGVEVTGEVIELREEYDQDNGRSYLPIFQYQYEGQVFQQGGGVSTNPPAYKVGETATLLVDPDAPRNMAPKKFVNLWLFPLAFGGVGLLLMRRPLWEGLLGLIPRREVV